MIAGIVLRKKLQWMLWVARRLIEINNPVKDTAGANH